MDGIFLCWKVKIKGLKDFEEWMDDIKSFLIETVKMIFFLIVFIEKSFFEESGCHAQQILNTISRELTPLNADD